MLVTLGWMVLAGLTHPARPIPIVPDPHPPARHGVGRPDRACGPTGTTPTTAARGPGSTSSWTSRRS